MPSFRDAATAKDLDAIEAMLADDVVFLSPVAHKPYPGKHVTAEILRAVSEVLEQLTYVRQMIDGAHHAYMFTAKVDGLDVTGCDFLTFRDDRIVEFMVMVRPLKAAQALAAKMGERFPAIQAAVMARMST